MLVKLESGAHVALKFMGDCIQDEIDAELLAQRVDHKHVINLRDYHAIVEGDEVRNVMVYDYAPGGELFDMLNELEALEEVECRTYFKQLISGLSACHTQGIVHRDIKLQNILLDENYELILADFGAAKACGPADVDENGTPKGNFEAEEQLMKSWVGTHGYQAPEIVQKKRYTLAVDIFSAGVVLFLLLTGDFPFDRAWLQDSFFALIFDRKFEEFWEKQEEANVNIKKISPDCRDLLNKIFEYNPDERITLDEIQTHEWFCGETLETHELKRILEGKMKEAQEKRVVTIQKEEEFRNRTTDPLETGLIKVCLCFLPTDESSICPDPEFLNVAESTEVLQIIRHAETIINKEFEWGSIQVTYGLGFVDPFNNFIKVDHNSEITIIYD